MLAVQVQRPHRLSDQQRVRPDHRLDQMDLVLGLFQQHRAVAPHQFQLGGDDEFLQRLLVALDQQGVPGPDQGVAARSGLALAVADQGHHLDVVRRHGLQGADGLGLQRPVVGHARLGQIGVGRQGRRQADGPRPVLGQQPIAEREEHQGHPGQDQAHRRIVKHLERRPDHVLTHLGDQNIGRGSDQGHHPARHGAEGHGHQQPRLFGPRAPTDLQRDRHHDGQGADVLGHHRQQGDGRGQHRHLGPLGLQIRHDPLQGHFDDAGLGEGRRHDQGAGDDHRHIVGEPLERRLGRDHPDGQPRHQGRHRDQIIPEPAPDEGRNRQADQAEGQTLL